MSNNINPRPLESVFQMPIVDSDGKLSRFGRDLIRDLITRSDKVLTNLGEVQAQAPVQGRSEGIGTTVQHVDSTGTLQPAGVGFDVDAVPDGATYKRTTSDEKTGAGRGFNALDANNRLSSSFHATAVNVSNTPTGATQLSNDGISTAIVIASGTNRFAPSGVSYNSGSVDPGAFGTYYIYADDPNFAGGAVIYQFTTDPSVLTAAEGRVPFGKITTVGGSAKTGGGNTGGTTTGGAGGRGYIAS